MDTARDMQSARVGGKTVPLNALQEAQAKARKLHKTKKQTTQETAA